MWTRKSVISALLAVLSLSALSLGLFTPAHAEAATEPDTITISRADWNALIQSNKEQRTALEESQRELSEVKKAQVESEQALSEAKILLETSQMTSDEMTKLCATLLNELNLSKAENAKLTQELKTAKAESLTAYEAIARANQYLQDTKKEIEANEAAWRNRENQLERQRLEWQIASALIGWIGYKVGRH